MTSIRVQSSNASPVPPTSLAILDRVLDEHAGTWTRGEAAGIMRLVIRDEALTESDAESRQELEEQFSICLELVKCRARMKSRSLKGD